MRGVIRRAALLCALLVLACDAARAPEAPPLSQPLMAALAQARAYHHIADLQLAEGAPDAAAVALERILLLPFPAGAPEGEDALLDARARLAKLHVAAGRVDEARRVLDAGFVAARRDSFFLANLHAVAGELHEARARALAADPAAARLERRAAIAAYERSIQINERVQRRLLEEARR
jgi:hypothetical protein